MSKSKALLLSLLTASLLHATPTHAANAAQVQEEAKSVSIFLDGRQLQPEVEPYNVNGTLLVPMRGLFEAEGARLTWDNATKTVTAKKGTRRLFTALASTPLP